MFLAQLVIGTVCLSILNDDQDWRPAITVKQVLVGMYNMYFCYVVLSCVAIQDLLNDPNPNSPAQRESYELFVGNRSKYNEKIREQARKNIPDY